MNHQLLAFQNAVEAAKKLLSQPDLSKALAADTALKDKITEAGLELAALSAEVAFLSAESGGDGPVF